MRRLLAVLLILCLCAPVAYADFNIGFGTKAKVMVYQVINATGVYSNTAVPTTTIVPGTHKIIGVTITRYDTTLGSEYMYGLWDTTAGSNGVDEVIDENEAANNDGKTTWFTYPLSLETQLNVHQGANTVVLVYYTR